MHQQVVLPNGAPHERVAAEVLGDWEEQTEASATNRMGRDREQSGRRSPSQMLANFPSLSLEDIVM